MKDGRPVKVKLGGIWYSVRFRKDLIEVKLRDGWYTLSPIKRCRK